MTPDRFTKIGHAMRLFLRGEYEAAHAFAAEHGMSKADLLTAMDWACGVVALQLEGV